MKKIKNIIGQKFGRWVVIKFAGREDNRTLWLCRCQCGKEKIIWSASLFCGESKSCGCLQREQARKRMIGHEYGLIHGLSHSKVYRTWTAMKQRCYNSRHINYKNYGERGIKVCRRWHKFENFFHDMGHPPSPKHSIDRINNDGNYEPSNCRWATRKEQNSNRRKKISNHTIGFTFLRA